MSCLRSYIVIGHAWTTLNGWINMQTETSQGHHQMYIFFKCIFTCLSTSTSFEYSSGISTNISFSFSQPQNNITKFKLTGHKPSGILLHHVDLIGLPFIPDNFPAPATSYLLPLGSVQWAQLVLFSVSRESVNCDTASTCHCNSYSSLNQISSFH